MNVGDEQSHIRSVFRNRKLPWRSFYFGQNYAVPDSIGVNSYPVYILLDREHKIRSISFEVDHRAIDELLGAR